MKNYIAVLFVLLFAGPAVQAQIPSYDAETLMERVSNKDTFYVINFWATWCGPCVKEMPEFEKLHRQYAGQPVKILMVSLDFKEDYPRKVEAFIKRKKLDMEVVWLNETNPNKFIPKIEPRWEGAIPATLLLFPRMEYRNFFEGMVKAKQLSTLIDRQLALKP